MKILFLDVDGVMNSEETLRKQVTREYHPSGIDPYLALLVNRIIETTGCEVVLSSAWRGSEENHKYIEKMIGAKLRGITPRCCAGIRGVEIHMWLQKNVDGFSSTYKGDFKIAILDDDSDMLLWQSDFFFKTSFKTGITPEVVESIINHLGVKEI